MNLTEEQVLAVQRLLAAGTSIRAAARYTGVSRQTVELISKELRGRERGPKKPARRLACGHLTHGDTCLQCEMERRKRDGNLLGR